MQVVGRDDVKGFEVSLGGGKKSVVRVLIDGDKMTLMLNESGAGGTTHAGGHSHPNEQIGYCLRGKAEFRINDKPFVVGSGMAYSIPPNEKHSVKYLEDSVLLEWWSPPRKDWVERQRIADLSEK